MSDALPDSVLLPYQKRWVADESPLKIAEKSRRTGLTYISTWNITSNEKGVYDAFFSDAKRRRRRLRADDGIHFSFLGYDRVAQHVLSIIRKKQPNLLPE